MYVFYFDYHILRIDSHKQREELQNKNNQALARIKEVFGLCACDQKFGLRIVCVAAQLGMRRKS
jgi:hypothetical protein